jgi:hypothetical protein
MGELRPRPRHDRAASWGGPASFGRGTRIEPLRPESHRHGLRATVPRPASFDRRTGIELSHPNRAAMASRRHAQVGELPPPHPNRARHGLHAAEDPRDGSGGEERRVPAANAGRKG